MKCKSCGANVSSNEPACTYCSTINEVYLKRKAEKEYLKSIFNSEKRKALKEAAPDIVVRVLNRLIIVSSLILLLIFVISFGLNVFFQEFRPKKEGDYKEHISMLDKMHKENRIDEMLVYIYEYGLYDKEYSVYYQVSRLYDYMNSYLAYNKFIKDGEKMIAEGNAEYSKNRLIEIFNDLIRSARSILNYTKNSNDIKEIYPENMDYYNEYITEVTGSLKYSYGLSDGEIEELCSFENDYGDDFINFCGNIYDKYITLRKGG